MDRQTSVPMSAPLEYGVWVWNVRVECVPTGMRVEKGYRAIGSIMFIPTDFNP